jgi:two-component system, cell cycle response regulator
MNVAQPGRPMARPPLILIAQDEEWSARSIESILGPNGFAVLRSYTARQTVESALSARPDAILLDDGLKDRPGYDVCRQLAGDHRIGPTTPIFMMTTAVDTRARRLEAFRAGAWELLQLPADAEELLLRLNTFVRSKLEADRACEEGLVDHATGLYNLRGLLLKAAELGAEASRFERPLSCVVVSVDAEEAEGQGSADSLDSVGHGFRETIRSCDTLGRLGPNQFAVLTPVTGQEGALRLAERLLSSVESGGPAMQVRAGFYGVADFRAASLDPAELVARATMALRQGSPAGADNIRSYDMLPQQTSSS